MAAAKERTAAEVKAAIQAGIRHVGHSYVQEARAMISSLANERTHVVRVSWHMVGHLQRNMETSQTPWQKRRKHSVVSG